MFSYMPAGTPHFVISLEDTIAHGLHSINAAQIQPTVFNVLHNFITEGAFANAEHHPIQLLLIRMFIYWVEILMRNPPLSTIHSPNIHTGEGLLDLLTLYSYVILYPALLLDTYPLMKPTQAVFGTASVMSAEQYQEYKLALHHAVVLNRWMDMKFVIGETNTTSKRMLVHQATRTFDWLCDVSIVHMAGCLAQYRADWLARKRQVTANFTTTTLKQQLRRTLCAYYSAWENNWHTLGDSSDFEISLEVNVLCERFDRRVQDLTYTHFMPWDLLSRGMPYFAKKENHIMAQKKRPALPDEENPRKRPRNDN
ncbi:hypothetical protein R3P38DRAFT_3188499 [Favolaschia claudopus]|uniref:Uncharacterized protein n=1 Tax=Favolaschia claudopus TaxID=2862362 RepID=A0AAW0BX21_9AGAR